MTIEQLLYILVTTNMLSIAGLFVLIKWTPALPFIIARISTGHVPLGIIGVANRLRFVTAKLNIGMLLTKKDGLYQETAGSNYNLKRIPTFFAFENHGSTLPLDYPAMVQELRARGFVINNFDDFKKFYDGPNKEAIFEYAPSKTVRVGDLQHLFPANDNPSVIEAQLVNQKTQEKLKQGKDYFKWIIIIGGIAIVAYIAYSLFNNMSSPEPINVICKLPDIVGSGVSNVSF